MRAILTICTIAQLYRKYMLSQNEKQRTGSATDAITRAARQVSAYTLA